VNNTQVVTGDRGRKVLNSGIVFHSMYPPTRVLQQPPRGSWPEQGSFSRCPALPDPLLSDPVLTPANSCRSVSLSFSYPGEGMGSGKERWWTSSSTK